MNMRKTLLGALALAVLPVASIAAPLSNTQILNKAFMAMRDKSPSRVEGELDYNVTIKPVGTSGIDQAMDVGSKIGIHVHAIPNTDPNLSQSEGRISIEVTGSSPSALIPISWNGSLAGEWRMVDKMVYFRITDVPKALIDYAKENLQFDPTPLVGVWIGTSLDKEGLANGLSDLRPGSDTKTLAALTGTSESDLKSLERMPVVLVSRVEKTWKNDSNDEMRRMIFRINPAIIWTVQNLEIRKVPYDKYRWTTISSINKRYADLRAQLNRFAFAANVNVTKLRIERMEMAGNIVEQIKNDCTWSEALKRLTCKVSSVMTAHMSGGMSFLPDTGMPVFAPNPWKTPEEFQKMIEDLMPTSTASSTY